MTITAPSRATAPVAPVRRKPTRTAGSAAVTSALWLYAVIAIAPLVVMVSNSLRTTSDLFDQPLGLPFPLSIESYRTAWTQASFADYFLNSVLVTVGAVTLSTVVSVLAAYALARLRFPGSRVLESLFLSGLMLPVHLAILPIFYLLDGMGLVDSQLGLTMVYAAAGVPFSIFVLTNFFRQLPIELEEAAMIDGAGHFQVFFRIMLPLVRPAVATVVVFRFVPIWNDFLFPLVLLRTTDKYTLPVGLTTFFGEYQTDWSTLFAGLVIATVPLIILFILATKHIVAGLTAGMSK